MAARPAPLGLSPPSSAGVGCRGRRSEGLALRGAATLPRPPHLRPAASARAGGSPEALLALEGSLSASLRSSPPARARCRRPPTRCEAATAVPATGGAPAIAVVGAGFAGVATCYHLLRQAGPSGVSVHLYDVGGLGHGASGVAAGLLHPFTPKGKELWRGWDGLRATLELLEAAEAAAGGQGEPISWECGMIRGAKDDKQARQLGANAPAAAAAAHAMWGAEVMTPEEARETLPGLAAGATEGGVALHIPRGRVLHSGRYIAGVWAACEQLAAQRTAQGVPCAVELRIEAVGSLDELEANQPGGGMYHAVVATAGAATGALLQPGDPPIPMTPCLGHVLDMEPLEGREGYPPGGPALLGSPYIAAHGPRWVVVGATKVYGEGAVGGGGAATAGRTGPEAAAAAESELLPKAAALWPPLAGWEVTGVREGVRGLPPRTHLGSIPLSGRVAGGRAPGGRWVFCGLGARGLVYHALVAESVAAAVAAGDPGLLLPETTQWQNK